VRYNETVVVMIVGLVLIALIIILAWLFLGISMRG
jgi:hypothetical protein